MTDVGGKPKKPIPYSGRNWPAREEYEQAVRIYEIGMGVYIANEGKTMTKTPPPQTEQKIAQQIVIGLEKRGIPHVTAVDIYHEQIKPALTASNRAARIEELETLLENLVTHDDYSTTNDRLAELKAQLEEEK